jgi:N-acetylated-alpha-linked acidic dipeptidase
MPNKLIRATSIVLFVALLSIPITSRYVFSQGGNAMRLDGYSAESSNTQRRWEEQFRAVPAPKSAREHLKRLTIEPHIAGTKEDYATAVYVRDQLRSYGLNAELKEYQVWLNYPNTTPIVELIGKRRQRLPVTEAIVPGDPTSSNPKITPLFNGYSASGDVTGPLVYANYGLPGDYEELKKLGVDVKGKIVIVRYGNSFRGVKAKVAQDHGAIGCIIYSDPADDGYMQGDVYPKGPWRPVASGQRGSVQYLFDYPGDPLTPGKPAVAGVARLKPEEATDLTKIPVQPIAYDVAKTLIAPLEGPVRPKGFQGGLPFAYHVGGTNAVKVRLKTDMDYKIRTIWDVVARIDGNEEKDRWVVMGNHRDAWVFGAVDPNSGTSAMLEMGRGYAELLKQGWKPKRTIILCSWDAEEYGLIGSTEWAEDNATELREKAVAYLNVDVAVSGGSFGASSVPSLWKVLRDVTRDVKDPKTGKSIYQAWQDRSREAGSDNAPVGEARIGALGSGSDYTPFLQHLGVPSTDFGFNGDYGVYHSAYDSFYWMDHFGDPGFVYHVAAAQVWGTLGMRLADADALPFDYTDYANQIRDYFTEAFKLAKQRNLDNSYDEQSVASALDDFTREAARVEHDRQAMIGGRSDVVKLKKLNDGLIAVERDFIDERGLTGRSWYKHQIYAPGIYTGYAAQPLTDFRQSIDDRNSGTTRESLARIVDALKRATNTLRKARD